MATCKLKKNKIKLCTPALIHNPHPGRSIDLVRIKKSRATTFGDNEALEWINQPPDYVIYRFNQVHIIICESVRIVEKIETFEILYNNKMI